MGEHHNLIIPALRAAEDISVQRLRITASRNFYTVRIRLPDLLGTRARAEGNYRKIMKPYKQVQLLILDEWLLFPLKESEARDLLEIVEARYKKASPSSAPSSTSAAGIKLGDPVLLTPSASIVHTPTPSSLAARIP